MQLLVKAVLIASAMGISAAHAQSIVTDRPDQTESSSTVPGGSLQIEAGFLLGYTEDDNESNRHILAPGILFRYGIASWIELRVFSQIASAMNQNTSEKVNGMSDLEVGAKVQLYRKEGVATEVAFLTHVVFPTGSSGLSIEKVGTINKVSIGHQLGQRYSLGYNFGYNYFGIGSGNLTYSIAFGVSITEKVGLYIEPFGELFNLDTHVASFDAGFTYLVLDNLQLDFSFGTGFNHTMNYIAVGASWNIRKK